MIKNLLSLFKESSNSFDGQEKNERVHMLLRQHYFTVLFPLSFLFLFALVPIVAWLQFSEVISEGSWSSIFFFVSSIWYMFLWLSTFFILTLYSLKTVIITDRRIIENEQYGFFSRKVSELHAYRVQDVSVRTHGLIQTLLSFGDIAVQTAASEREFIFERIPHPEKVKDVIMKTVTNHRSDLKLH